MALLRDACHDMLAGRARLVLVAGEPGIGKTRTAEVVAAMAAERGAAPLWGRCFDDTGAPPFWPWVQILRALRARCAPEDLTAGDGRFDEVAALLSETGATRDADRMTPFDSPQARFRLFEQIVNLLERCARNLPLLLVLDDLHDADTPSLRLLEFVARSIDAPVLILGCHRMELETTHPLTATQIETLRMPGAQQLVLRGLTAAEVAQLVARAAGVHPDAELVRAIHERTEGNPLFVKEYVQWLLSRHHRSAVATASVVRALAVPDTIRALVRRRMEPLAPDCLPVLVRAATIGRSFAVSLLNAAAADLVSPVNEGLVARVITAAAAAGLIAPDHEPDTYRFTHAIMRETLRDDMTPTERTRLHQLIGQALAARGNADQHLPELAHHFSEAGGDSLPLAISYARRAGDRAMAVLAYEEAVRLYDIALDASRRCGASNDAERCALLINLGRARNGIGDLDGSKAVLLQAASLAKRLNLRQELADAALHYGSQVPWGEGPVVDPVRLELVENALEVWAGTAAPTEAALLARLALALRFSPDVQRIEHASDRAVELARRHHDPVLLLSALHAWHLAHFKAATCDERLRIATEMAGIAERLGDREMAFQACWWQVDDRLESADRAGADRAFAAGERLGQQLRQPYCTWMNRLIGAFFSALEGRFGDARTQGQAAVELGRTINPGADNVHQTSLAHLSLASGRPDELRAAAESMGAFAEAFAIMPAYRAAVAHIGAELDDAALARRYFEPFRAGELSLPDDQVWLLGTSHLAAACSWLEDVSAAPALYESLRPYASRLALCSGPFTIGPVALYLGRLADLLGRPTDAVRHFETALAICMRMRTPPWLARTQYEYARVLLNRDAAGDRDRARALLASASATAQVLDMPLLAQRTSTLTARLPVTDGHSPRAAFHAAAAGTDLFRHDGEYWTIVYRGAVVRLKGSKGLRYLSYLLSHPGEELLALDLLMRCRKSASFAASAVGHDRALPALDSVAKAAYAERLTVLREALDEAERTNDRSAAERARTEIRFIADELAAAIGLAGRDRSNGSSAERARSTVTKGIKSAIAKIAASNPSLGRHLDWTVRTGVFCSYVPDPDDAPRWQFTASG